MNTYTPLNRSPRSAAWPAAALVGIVGLAALLSTPAPLRAQTDTPTPQPQSLGSDYYGINFIQPRQPWLTIGYNSGARIVRWQFNWRDIEPFPGDWSWDMTDTQVSAWNTTGLKIHAILHNPPDYALADPASLIPANLEAPWTSPGSTFAHYCNQFAGHYRGRIASYEIWNEPDLTQYWSGSADQYYGLLKACDQGIRAADPITPVVMAGMAYTTNKGFFADVIRAAKRDPDGPANKYFFDAAAIHMYTDPELLYTNTLSAREVLSAYGMGDKPIWITETNVPLRGANGVPDTPQPGLATPDEASWFVLQAASNAIAAGAGKLMFFRLADDQMTGQAWGLVANTATPRPAYRALQLAAALLQNIREAKRDVIDDDVVVTDMRRSDGSRIVTAYSRSGRAATVSVQAETSAAVLIDSAGGYSPVEPGADGTYTITLPPAPGRDIEHRYLYSVGGPVLILAESDRDAPTATIETVRVPLDKLHVLVRWHGDDGRFGTGVALYEVQTSSNGTDWQPWQTNTTETQATFDLSQGGTFGFRVRATDRAGNVGQFSTPAVATLKIAGTLSGHIVDLRGQDVPSARVQLSDGSLHDADGTGWVHVDLPLGTAQVAHVDGGARGKAGQQPTVPIKLAEETTATWLVIPPNLIANGDFTGGLDGWNISSPEDVQWAGSSEAQPVPVLRLNGQRRPWGPPAASLTVKIPPEYTAGVFSFTYRLVTRGNTLRLRAISPDEQAILWQTDTLMNQWERIWVDVSRYAGREVTFQFELWGPKGGPASTAELDQVIVANVPVQPSP